MSKFCRKWSRKQSDAVRLSGGRRMECPSMSGTFAPSNESRGELTRSANLGHGHGNVTRVVWPGMCRERNGTAQHSHTVRSHPAENSRCAGSVKSVGREEVKSM